MGLLPKELKALRVLGKGRPVIAAFSNSELSSLARMGLAHSEACNTKDGRLALSVVWTITPKGKAFLAELGSAA